MRGRTDLAVDISELSQKGKVTEKDGITVTTVKIETNEEEEAYQKPMGTYITVEFPPLFRLETEEPLQTAIGEAVKALRKTKEGSVLVVGLGNTDITADSIGPKTAGNILATRHIMGKFAESIGLSGLKSVAVLTPSVLGKTGIEAVELIKGAVETVNPSAVIAVDALASNSVSRLFRTVQLCDSGISPGSGVKNSRKEISEKTLGVPVIALGIPTVVDAEILAEELTGGQAKESPNLVVTPKDSDLLTDKISQTVSMALNRCLQPELSEDILRALL